MMICAKDLDEIYFLYSVKAMKKDEFIKKLVSFLLKNPNYFGLDKLTEDMLFDFIFEFFPKINSVLSKFKLEKANFSSYFQGIVRMAYSNWRRKLLKSNLRELAITNYSENLYDQKAQENSIFEPEVKYENKLEEIECRKTEILASYKVNKINMAEKKITRQELLVIMLKSVFYLTPKQISNYMKAFDIEFNEIGGLIIQAEESIEAKIKIFNNLKETTNKEYMKKEELKFALSKLDKDSSLYNEYEAKYASTYKRWKNRKERFEKTRVIPSDKVIASILNISESKVRYILRKYYRIFKITEKQ